jgi:hypothetical protein
MFLLKLLMAVSRCKGGGRGLLQQWRCARHICPTAPSSSMSTHGEGVEGEIEVSGPQPELLLDVRYLGLRRGEEEAMVCFQIKTPQWKDPLPPSPRRKSSGSIDRPCGASQVAQ